MNHSRGTVTYHIADDAYIAKELQRLKDTQDKIRALPSLAEIRAVIKEMNAKGIFVDRMLKL